MKKCEDANTRYYIDLDLRSGKILACDYDQKSKLVKQEMGKPSHHRVYITKGQFNKLAVKQASLEDA